MKWLIPITVLLYCASDYSQSDFYITCVDNTCGEMRASIDFVRDGDMNMPITIRRLNRQK